MNVWTVYWLFQLDTIRPVFGFFGTAFMIAGTAFGIACMIEGPRWVAKILFPLAVLGSFMAITALFMPSTKTMAAIIVLPRIASAENLDIVAKDGGDIYKLAMARLKESLGEVK